MRRDGLKRVMPVRPHGGWLPLLVLSMFAAYAVQRTTFASLVDAVGSTFDWRFCQWSLVGSNHSPYSLSRARRCCPPATHRCAVVSERGRNAETLTTPSSIRGHGNPTDHSAWILWRFP